MDLIALTSLITNGGPTALFVILGLIVLYQAREVLNLKKDLESFKHDFCAFRIEHAGERVTKDDLVAIDLTLNKLFDLLRDQRMYCGKDCIAAKSHS